LEEEFTILEGNITGIPKVVVDGNVVDFSKYEGTNHLTTSDGKNYSGQPILYDDKVKNDDGTYTTTSRTLVPIRAVAELAGYDVTWKQAEKTIIITPKETNGVYIVTAATDEDGELIYGDDNHVVDVKVPEKSTKIYNRLLHMASDVDRSSCTGDEAELDAKFGTTYLLFGLKELDTNGVLRFADRIALSGECKFGCYLTVGNSNGISYMRNNDKTGVDEIRVAYKMDIPAVMYDDRTLVPIRAVGEMLGYTVGWSNNTVTLTSVK
jgi:hypothetical protein